MSEIITCPNCGQEIDLLYSQSDESQVVSQTRCRCTTKLINGLKPLDYFIQQKEMYAKDQSGTSKISVPIKAGHKGF